MSAADLGAYLPAHSIPRAARIVETIRDCGDFGPVTRADIEALRTLASAGLLVNNGGRYSAAPGVKL